MIAAPEVKRHEVLWHGEWSPVPHFEGWVPLPWEAAFKLGDAYYHPYHYRDVNTSPVVNADRVGETLALITSDRGYLMYRRERVKRLPGNPLYADPLPLP